MIGGSGGMLLLRVERVRLASRTQELASPIFSHLWHVLAPGRTLQRVLRVRQVEHAPSFGVGSTGTTNDQLELQALLCRNKSRAYLSGE